MRGLRRAVLAIALWGIAATAAEPRLALPEGAAAQAPAFTQLRPVITSYNTWVGGYPPRFKNPAERAAVYQRWCETLREARAFQAQAGETAEALWSLAALYRMGHNMDVVGAATEAIKYTELGLEKFPDSLELNAEASYLYLSIDPKYASRGEAALLRLRKLRGTNRDPEIERGLVFAYLYQNRIPEAQAQVEHCLTITPKDKMMLNMREGLKKPVEHRKGPPPAPTSSQ
jgi:tetratricopeptide (TPR) repeat protein